MLFTDQLVVLPTRAEPYAAAICALERARRAPSLRLRDAAALTRAESGDLVVTEVGEEWEGRRPLPQEWWTTLGCAIADDRQVTARTSVEAPVSRSFLAEVAKPLANGLTLVMLVAERVESGSLVHDVGGEPFVRVIYGCFPETTIDDLTEMRVER